MKKFKLVLVLLFLYVVCTTSEVVTEVNLVTTTEVVDTTRAFTQVVKTMGLKKFLDKLAFVESRGKSWIVSKTGYLGKYQFNIKTIKGLGFDVTEDEFLNNENLQDSVVIAYLHHNKRVLKKYIKEYEGQYVDSVCITKAGVLAAAHLVGPSGVIAFLTKNNQASTSDGNGTSAKKYMQLFSNYRLKEI